MGRGGHVASASRADFRRDRGAVVTAPEEGLWDPQGIVTAEDVRHIRNRFHPFHCSAVIKTLAARASRQWARRAGRTFGARVLRRLARKKRRDQRLRAKSTLLARRAVPCLLPRLRHDCRKRTVPCRARVPCRGLLGSSSACEVPLACCAVPCMRAVPRRAVLGPFNPPRNLNEVVQPPAPPEFQCSAVRATRPAAMKKILKLAVMPSTLKLGGRGRRRVAEKTSFKFRGGMSRILT